MSAKPTLGFIGLGTMGEPMCRNLAKKAGRPVLGYDIRPEPMRRLKRHGVKSADSIADLLARAEIVFLSLPGAEELEQVVEGPGGIVEAAPRGRIIVDHSTAPVDVTRDLATTLAENRIDFLDAPVARTRRAAADGTLAIMVGGRESAFKTVNPYLKCMGTSITYCGDSGCGQTAKLLNNMVLVETVAALADALAIGRRAGLDGELLFKVMSEGSADSFALRNHGMRSMVKGDFPENAFSTLYALKDVTYALDLARDTRVEARLAKEVERLLRRTVNAGLGDAYFPALVEIVEAKGGGGA